MNAERELAIAKAFIGAIENELAAVPPEVADVYAAVCARVPCSEAELFAVRQKIRRELSRLNRTGGRILRVLNGGKAGDGREPEEHG